MPLWDGAGVLAEFKRQAGLQAASEYDDATDLYPRASIAQQVVMQRIAERYPNPLYTAPFTLTPSGDRKTFTFGNDSSGQPIMPMGWVQIAPFQNAFSGDRFVGWREGQDFIDEGTQIRIVSNRAWSGTLYCRAVLTPPDISAVVAPVLNPAPARVLIAIQMTKVWAGEGNRRPDLVQSMTQRWADEFPGWMLTFRNRYKGGGAVIDPARWWLAAPDIGSTGS